jgi:hypothetical protein
MMELVQKTSRNSLEATGIGKDFLSRAYMAQQLRKDGQMELHEIKKLLYHKRNGF